MKIINRTIRGLHAKISVSTTKKTKNFQENKNGVNKRQHSGLNPSSQNTKFQRKTKKVSKRNMKRNSNPKWLMRKIKNQGRKMKKEKELK